MTTPLSPAAKKAYEVAYALFRVADTLTITPFADALRQEGLHLLWNAIRHSRAEAETGIKALYYLIAFGKDTGTVNQENGDLLIRQLESLAFLLAGSFHSGSDGVPAAVDIAGIFSDLPESVIAAPSAVRKAKPSAQAVRRPEPRKEIALGPAQKERQEMILGRIRQSGSCRTGEIQAILPDLSERTLRYDLQRLIEQGKIERGGAGPASWYRIKESAKETVPERNVSEVSSL